MVSPGEFEKYLVDKRAAVELAQRELDLAAKRLEVLTAELKGAEEAARLLQKAVSPGEIAPRASAAFQEVKHSITAPSELKLKRPRQLGAHYLALLRALHDRDPDSTGLDELATAIDLNRYPEPRSCLRSMMHQLVLFGYCERERAGWFLITRAGIDAVSKEVQPKRIDVAPDVAPQA